MSTPFFSAIFTPSAAAFATAQICGSVKQVVTLVGMPREVTTFTTSTPSPLAGTFTITLGAIARISCASLIMRSVSVSRRGSSCPDV